MSVLTGATVHRERLLTVAYPVVGQIAVHECSLSEGVGARLWGISHSFNKYLISQKHEIEGKHVLEIGSGVGSTGTVPCSSPAAPVRLGCFPTQQHTHRANLGRTHHTQPAIRRCLQSLTLRRCLGCSQDTGPGSQAAVPLWSAPVTMQSVSVFHHIAVGAHVVGILCTPARTPHKLQVDSTPAPLPAQQQQLRTRL